MTNSDLNNPAARLLSICEKLGERPNNQRLRAAWAHVTGCPEADTAELLRRLGAAITLVSVTRDAILALDHAPPELFLVWEAPVSSAFSNLDLDRTPVQPIKAILTKDVILSLRHCADVLNRNCPERTVSQEDLMVIRDSILEAMSEIQDCSCPEELKKFMLDKLDLLERAISMYMFTGLKPIETAIESIVGATVLSDDKSYYRDTRETSGGEAFWSICNKLLVVLTFAEKGQKLLEAIIP